MSLANLFNVPDTPGDMAVYSFNVMDQHRRIVDAIQAQKNITLPLYPLDPAPSGPGLQDWALQLQSAVNDFTGVLKIPGFDFTSVDPNNKAEFAAWTFLLGSQFRLANDALGLGG